MRRHLRIRLLVVAAIVVIAAAVWLVGASQRSTADKVFSEAAGVYRARAAVSHQAAHLIEYATSRDQHALDEYRKAGGQLEAALAVAREDRRSGNERRLLAAQARWQELGQALLLRVVASGRRLTEADTERIDARVDAVGHASDALLAELDRGRRDSQRVVGLLTAGVIVLLSAIFGGLAFVFFDRPARRLEWRRERHAGFTEVMQLARTEGEAYRIVKRHIERIVPDGLATVLNRNNSANRLEPATPIDDPDLAEALEGAEPEACIAVRSGRVHKRDGDGHELLTCEICGRRPGTATTCTPSLVGGEVIGSVLVEHHRALDGDDTGYLAGAIAEAAPIIANLRTLAVAELRAATDALTGLPNNRAVHETLRRMAAQAGRTTAPLAAVLFDLDHFKQVNDVHGHTKGDEVLAAVGDTAASVVRASDFVGRYGGEEFLALLPDTDREGGMHVAEKLRAAIAKISVPGVSRRISASFGVAVLPFDAGDPEQLLRVADRALYAAKANGRDRVELAADREPGEPALFSGEDG